MKPSDIRVLEVRTSHKEIPCRLPIALTLSCALITAGGPSSPRSSSPRSPDYLADVAEFRGRFDALAESLPHVQVFDGELAPWTQGYVLLGYALMYQATRDTRYLDEFIRIGDQVMAYRDCERGLKDYRGRSLPAWQARQQYLLHRAVLADDQGRPVLLVILREWLRPLAGTIDVTVERTRGESFNLILSCEDAGRRNVERFDNLSMNPTSLTLDGQCYVERRVNGFSKFVTAHVLQGASAHRAPPAEGTYPLQADAYVFHVHTGHLAHPFALVSRLIMQSDELRDREPYAAKAAMYLQAVEAAVAAHDEDWRENELGEGWYAAAADAPIWNAGLDEPFNHCHTLGLAMCELYRITHEERYRDRVAKLARAFRNDMRYSADADAYWWSYWWSGGRGYRGWRSDEGVPNYLPFAAGQPKTEDVAHGGISVRFAWSAYENGIVFERRDMQRLANALTGVIVGPQLRVAQRVTGGGPEVSATATGRWLDLALVDSRVYDLVKTMYLAEPWRGSEGLCTTAKLAAVAADLGTNGSQQTRVSVTRLREAKPRRGASAGKDLGVTVTVREVEQFAIPQANIAENADLSLGLTGFELADARKWVMYAQLEPDLEQKLTGSNSLRISFRDVPAPDVPVRVYREVNVVPGVTRYTVGWVMRLSNYDGIAGARVLFKDDRGWVEHPLKDQIHYDLIPFPSQKEEPRGKGAAPVLRGTTGWLNVEASIDLLRLRQANPSIAPGGVRQMLFDLFYGTAPKGGALWIDCFYVEKG